MKRIEEVINCIYEYLNNITQESIEILKNQGAIEFWI